MAGMLAVAAVAVIALEFDDGFTCVDDIAALDVAESGGDAGICIGVVVFHAETTADIKVISLYAVFIVNCDEAEVVSEGIDCVVLWYGDTDFEFSRHPLCAVKRVDGVFFFPADIVAVCCFFFTGLGGLVFFAVYPHFMIAGCYR